MEVLSLALTNYRNFSNYKLTFGERLTIIVGPNGSGKSNILEAFSFLSGIKPSRVQTDSDLIKFGKNDAKILVKVKGEALCELTINFLIDELGFVKKSYFVDSVKKRLMDFSEHLSVVVFSPEDLELVTGSPSSRRHHLDSELSAVDRDYWRSLSAYNKIVIRRNKVLQRILEGKSKPSELDFWDGRLLEHGKFISKKRQEFFEFLNFVEPTFSELSQETKKRLSDLSWELKQSLLSEEKLAKDRERDISAGVTLSGPHRDDFSFLYRKKNLEFFGSRGEQRMAILALKLAELEFHTLRKKSRPILALDDIFSELDWEHRAAVLGVIEKQQTIITAAEAQSVPKEILMKAKKVELTGQKS